MSTGTRTHQGSGSVKVIIGFFLTLFGVASRPSPTLVSVPQSFNSFSNFPRDCDPFRSPTFIVLQFRPSILSSDVANSFLYIYNRTDKYYTMRIRRTVLDPTLPAFMSTRDDRVFHRLLCRFLRYLQASVYSRAILLARLLYRLRCPYDAHAERSSDGSQHIRAMYKDKMTDPDWTHKARRDIA